MSIQLETLLKEKTYVQAMNELGSYIVECGERGISAPHYKQYFLVNIEHAIRKLLVKVIGEDGLRWQDIALGKLDVVRRTIEFTIGDTSNVGYLVLEEDKTSLSYNGYNIDIDVSTRVGSRMLDNVRQLLTTVAGSSLGETCDYACNIYQSAWMELVNEFHKVFISELQYNPILWMVPTGRNTFLLETNDVTYNVFVTATHVLLVDTEYNTISVPVTYAIADNSNALYERAGFILRSGVNHQYVQNPVLHEILDNLYD